MQLNSKNVGGRKGILSKLRQ